jgi:2-keto-4-pentenoate hydratase/2-oxohepta-3-ene-1,7-dioic acid hydratase in catechol pathway
VKIVTFEAPGGPRVGLALGDGRVLDLRAGARALGGRVEVRDPSLFTDTISLFGAGVSGLDDARRVLDGAMGALDSEQLQPALMVTPRLLPPVPRPPRVRDYLTSGQHGTNLKMPLQAALEQMPVCYQSNHLAVLGPEAEIPWPAYTDQLDYELEPALVVGLGGRDVSVSQALSHIVGVTLFNDVSARDIQALEMSTLVGPSKGKHFVNVVGPCVATLDEVEIDAWQLESRVNGEVWGGPKHWSADYGIAEVLSWASWQEDLHPGEVIALGTVGQGCGLEIGRWLQPGDVIELEMAGVGVLRNVIGPKQDRGSGGLPTFRGAPRFDPAARG